ncbi:MAG: hypothetical protein M3Y65_13890 [Pseudomonadota bacterium]|nr:hypothetical protein [Pseudomonadota bacterium]
MRVGWKYCGPAKFNSGGSVSVTYAISCGLLRRSIEMQYCKAASHASRLEYYMVAAHASLLEILRPG